MLTVLTWLWAQPGCRTQYTYQHVNVWAAMIRRHLTIPHRLACVTDIPEGIDPSIEIIRPPAGIGGQHTRSWPKDKPSCYRRISMFRRDAAEIFGERFVQIDLDVVIGGNMDSLFNRPEEIVLFRGTSGRRPYNGSMTLMTAGCRPHVYEQFTWAGAEEASRKFVGSDQAWMMYTLSPDEPTWGEEHGVWWYGSTYLKAKPLHEDVKVLFFPGREKPWRLSYPDLYTKEHYRIVERPDFIQTRGEAVARRQQPLTRIPRPSETRKTGRRF